MPPKLAPWPRARYQPGGGKALVFYVIYGEFSEEPKISASTYRTAGVPQGVDLRKVTRKQQPELPFTEDSFKVVRKGNAALFEQIKTAPECLILQGEVPDSQDLNYLRDVVGLVMFALDHGGLAVMDVQQLELFDAPRWRKEIFEPQPPHLQKQVAILYSDEVDGARWYHTRGLRKFGRPDLSTRCPKRELDDAVIEMFNRFILLQAQGSLIPEGQEIRMVSLPAGLTCHQAGSLDDPDFNNVHIEVRWLDGK